MTLEAADLREGRVLRCLWELGLCDASRLEAWADALIVRTEQPPYELTEVSLLRTRTVDSASLDILLKGSALPDEVLAALARVNSDELDIGTVFAILGSAYGIAIGFEHDPPMPGSSGQGLLLEAVEITDNAYFLEQRRVTETMVRHEISDYFRRVREFVASVEASR